MEACREMEGYEMKKVQALKALAIVFLELRDRGLINTQNFQRMNMEQYKKMRNQITSKLIKEDLRCGTCDERIKTEKDFYNHERSHLRSKQEMKSRNKQEPYYLLSRHKVMLEYFEGKITIEEAQKRLREIENGLSMLLSQRFCWV